MQDAIPDQEEIIDSKGRKLCCHIFIAGARCGSPAMRGENHCYYHDIIRRQLPIADKSGTFVMPRIDDRASVQLALYEVLNRLSSETIDPKRGALLLYGLQIASANLPRHARTDTAPQPQVEEVFDDLHLEDVAPIVEIPTPEPEILSHDQKELTPPTEPAILEPRISNLELEPCTVPPPIHSALTPYNKHNDFAYSGLPDLPRALPLSG